MAQTSNGQKKVVIIGAGPSGSIASALLRKKGYQVIILEREKFPRFSVGESLLPQCMEFVEEAGMLQAVLDAGFQLKTGADFFCGDKRSEFYFSDKFGPGTDTTFQVLRADFDMLLASEAQIQGVVIHWQHQVVGADFSGNKPVLTVADETSARYQLEADFVLDASGFGRVLARLLNLESPTDFPVRQALVTHIEDRINCTEYNRNHVRILVHPKMADVWYWLIPFSNGRCSMGMVGKPDLFDSYESKEQAFHALIAQEPCLSALLPNAQYDTPINTIKGYSANVSSLFGNGYALLGNAGEFLDPVFSSGITIAMKSASLAVNVLDRQFNGLEADWQNDFAEPLQKGVDTFRTYVTSWYEGGLQDVIFFNQQQPNIKAMICSILAGYVWDENNPYVKNSQARLKTLVELCRTTEMNEVLPE